MNTHISDLFFNRDMSDAFNVHGYDSDVLEFHAKDFLYSLDSLGVQDLPSVDELIENFFNRL